MPPPNLSDHVRSQISDLQFLASIASNQTSIPTNDAKSFVPFDAATGHLSQEPEPQPQPRQLKEPFKQERSTSSQSFCEVPDMQPYNTLNQLFQQTSSDLLPTRQSASYTRSAGHSLPHKVNNRKIIDHGSFYRNNRKDFILFIYVLLKILRKKPSRSGLFNKAKNIVQECLSCHRNGVAGYSPLMDVIDNRLRAVDGMAIHIRMSEGYFKRYLNRKRVSSLESIVKL